MLCRDRIDLSREHRASDRVDLVRVDLGLKTVLHSRFENSTAFLRCKDAGFTENVAIFRKTPVCRRGDHFLAEDADPVEGAKALAMLLMTLRGTPFIYQGEELGMTNVNRNSIEEYDDISSHNQYKMALENGLSEEQALKSVQQFSRDNARSPMQWNTDVNAGFTSGTPWLAVADNYLTVNAATEDADKKSVLNWYRTLNELRKEHPVFADGSYKELREDSEELFEYVRENEDERILVVINFTGKEVDFIPDNSGTIEFLISSYGDDNGGILRPYEAMCYIYK